MIPVVTVDTKFGGVKFFCPGGITVWRAETLLTKEPETIAWIDSFASGDVLWDIGANIGAYSIYSARRGLAVVSFEPEASSYAILNRNILLNGMDGMISAYCVALTAQSGRGQFYLENTAPGAAMHAFGAAVDWKGNKFVPAFRQAQLSFSVDDLIDRIGLPLPSHIKIDVDGLEGSILDGAVRTLRNPVLKSLLVEIEVSRLGREDAIVAMLGEHGFVRTTKMHSSLVAHGNFATGYNNIFVRG